MWRVDVEVNPVDPPGALRRVGARRKLELVGVGGGSTERLNSRRPSQACGRSRGKARKHQRWHMASWPNNGGKRPTAGWRPTESEWSISHRPELAASVASGPRARRLVHSDPLNEPDHVIDVRNLLAKSGSPSHRHPMASHRHQFRSSTPPSVRRRRSSPQPKQGADALAPPPAT